MIVTDEYKLSFWSHVNKIEKENCWLWIGKKHRQGYGFFSYRGKTYLAHRIALELSGTLVPSNLDVLHTCDTPSCVNPKHLFLGNAQINTNDCAIKGRCKRASGEQNGNSKLTEVQIVEIRRIYSTTKICMQDLSKRFNVSAGLICKIVNNKVWRHLS